MSRTSNSNTNGNAFGSLTIEAVWQKATPVQGYAADTYRKDACGAWICRTEYGKTTEYGWEIDHIKPVSAGGSDELSNLQPLHWQNNRHKADNWPHWSCKFGSP